MDSGNSGSLQSSSGGDEEYDSRAESISVFLSNNNNNNNPLTHVGPISNPPPPQPPPPSDHHQHHQTHHSSSSSFMFDPSANYFDPLSSSSSRSPPPAPPPHLTNPNSFLNLDMVWSKNLRSETNCTDLGNFIPSSSQTQQFFTNQTQSRTTFPSIQISHQGPESSTTPRGSTSNDQTTNTNATTTTNMVRNPKKRSRASRRAPTTVLTTDTTNFRAMVQEFTGIPAPPFTSSHFPRTRLDLFGTSSTLRSATTHLEPPPPPYLLRPFAQKFQPPFLSSTSTSSSSVSTTSPSVVDAIASTTTANNINIGSSNNNNNNSHSNSSTSLNYHLSSDLALLKQPQNLLDINMQNPILNLHSLLQPSPKYPLPNSSVSNDSHLKMGVLEEFGLSHGHVSTNLTGFHTIVAGDGVGSGAGSNNNESDHHHHHNHQGLLRSINGNYNNSQRVVNGKANFSSSSDHFHGDKGPEINVGSRSEGMVESWICSSD